MTRGNRGGTFSLPHLFRFLGIYRLGLGTEARRFMRE